MRFQYAAFVLRGLSPMREDRNSPRVSSIMARPGFKTIVIGLPHARSVICSWHTVKRRVISKLGLNRLATPTGRTLTPARKVGIAAKPSNFAEQTEEWSPALSCLLEGVHDRQLRRLYTLPAHHVQVRRRSIFRINGGTPQKLVKLALLRRNPAAGDLSLGSHAYLASVS